MIHADALAHDWGRRRFDIVRRQSAVLVADVGGDDARRLQSPRRRAVRRCRRRVPGARVRLADQTGDASASCCRSRSSAPATPGRCARGDATASMTMVVVGAAPASLRRRRERVCARISARDAARAGAVATNVACGCDVDARRHRRARNPAPPRSWRLTGRSATGPTQRQLPRRVLRPGARRLRHRRRAAAGDERPDRPRRVPLGRAPVTLRQAGARSAPRRPHPAHRPLPRAGRERKLVPKVLVANQTRIVEAVADPRRRMAARRPGQHRDAPPTGHDGVGDRRRADLAGGVGRCLAARRRHRALGHHGPDRPGAAGVGAVAGRRPRPRCAAAP